MAENSFVLDTHVWISIFHTKKNEKLLDALIEKDFIIMSADEQEKELRHVMDYPEIKELLPGKPDNYLKIFEAIVEVFPTSKRFALYLFYKSFCYD